MRLVSTLLALSISLLACTPQPPVPPSAPQSSASAPAARPPLPLSSACPDFHADGLLPVLPERLKAATRELCFEAFGVLHSGRTRTPLWVAERLTREQLQDAADETRTNQFYEEARLPTNERARLQDYKGSGFDRGHMAAAANMPTPSSMAQSFSLANIVPQPPTNNRGIWAEMEVETRELARKLGMIHVVSGALFIGSTLSQLNDRVFVPSHLWKAVLDPVRNEAFVWTVENTDTAAPRSMSVQEFEKFSGITVFPGRQPAKAAAPKLDSGSKKRR